MQTFRLETMTRGWFVGDFQPTLYATESVEVGVKRYASGDTEARHVHKIATEITVIISGKVKMNDRIFGAGDIIVLKPNESTDFEALAETVLTVVKIPGAKDDKYLVNE